ncbi:SDR family oxidoreductase [Adhaeretor mobilis]|uniref:Glucose 1-dehydrogenase 2 n=1 Tax=Adhaeretor mobilis TaxID=1930276 RepID=A0A517MT05_9BACT|nr:SDR family oxidoreductase [Adhaeretor mobilis]QDS97927.1 Glucose 1-dehydrogenase 2 [Adhaeretor mobilis]
MAQFTNKCFVITGGSGGIGKATAKRITEEGGRVLVTGTNQDKLDTAVKEIEGLIALKNDAGDPAAAEELAAAAKEHFGQLDGVFLNAGYGMFVPHTEVTAEQFDQQYGVNVRGPILHAKVLSPLVKEGGALLLNTSVAQDLGMEGGVLYNSTKGAMRTITRVLARELAPRKIRVNAVSPGPIGSDFFDRTGMDDQQQEQMTEQIKSQVPLGRFGEPEEIASAAVFLLSTDASYITGAELTVDGGMNQM